MPRRLTKNLSIFLCFLLIFQQSGFAQIAAELDLSAHFARLSNSFIPTATFRPLHLRYLSYDPAANNFNLLLDKGDFVKGLSPKGADPKESLQQETKTLLNYFFIGISLPNQAFWVNLRPDSPNNIIDPELAETDIGRILLEADLQLKKDTANFTSPQTTEGKEYWDKLYKKAEELYGNENITIPTLTRPWIVPDEIIIRESSDNAYIYKATLKVMLESDYLKTGTILAENRPYVFKDDRSKTLNEYSSQLIRESIIPKLTKEINSSKRYAPLRQVYYSLILAQWFKQRFYSKSGLYCWLIDRKNLTGLTSKEEWSKTTYFNAYKQSFQQGEYNIKEPVYAPYGQTIRSYMSGGMGLQELLKNAKVILGSEMRNPTGPFGVKFHNNIPALVYGSNSAENISIGKIEIGTQDAVSTAVKQTIDGPRVVASSAINNANAGVSPLGHGVILEFCINYLRERNLIITESNENGNETIIIKTTAFNHPDETARRSADAIRNWVEQLKKEGKATRFQNTNGIWVIIKFESEPGDSEAEGHKQQKAGYEEQDISWREEIVNIAEARSRLISDRLGIAFDQTASWERANPDKAKIIQERLEEISENDEQRRIYLQSIDSQYVIVDRNEPSFQYLYSETEEIVKRLLMAAGFNPDNFSFSLLDSTTANAFIISYVNKIFVNMGLVKFIIENGGSKDALAFVIAHEIRHILQWVDDVIADKPLERGMSGIVGRHADEYDADNDLALIDKAGYSVKDAEFFFAKFLEKKGKSTRLSLGFLTHPPTETRLRKIQRNISKFFWINFFNKAEYFSDESKQELNNRTRHRLFQEEALKPWASFNYIRQLSNKARTPEEYIFLLYAQARNFALTSDVQKELKEYFLNRFAADNQAKQKAFEIVIDIVIADLVSMQSGMFITRGGGIQNHRVAQNIKIKFESASLTELIELLNPPFILPLMSYRYDKSSQSYKEDGSHPDFNYTDFIGILCYAASERLKVLFSIEEVNIQEITEFMKLFKERYSEAKMYAKMAIPQDVNNFLEKLISMSLALLLSDKDKTKDIEYLRVILPYFDMFEDIRNIHGSSISFITDLCKYLKRADQATKQFLVDNWILKSERSSELKHDFFARMLSAEFYDVLPEMGKNAESDIDALFNNTYFREHIITGYTLARWIKLLSQKYTLSPQDSIKLYEKVLRKLSTLALSYEKEQVYYNDLFKCITERGAFSFRGDVMEVIKLEGIDERINEFADIPKDIHPELKRLIYFYRLGGILSFGSTALQGGLRDVLMRIKMRSDKGYGPLLKREDVEVFYRHLLSQKTKIKQRYTDESETEKEMHWSKYILPLALYVSFDQEALSEDEYRYENTKPKKVGVMGEDGKSRTEIRPGKPNRFGRFIGEFNPLGTVSRFFSRDDYQKTKVDRGRGINRVFLTGENVDALLQVFDYIVTSDKGFEVLLNEILRALPATAYRNFALYTLFVKKFIGQECGVSIDINRMFDLGYVQNIIGDFNPQQRKKASQVLSRISSLMVRDVEMEQLNEPNENVLSKLDDAEKQRISNEHAFEESGYYPFEFTELGGVLSQLDIFVGLLAENNILEALKSMELSFSEKLDLALKYFPRNSNTRDRFLILLIESNMTTPTSADIERTLPLFNNNSFREKYAVWALEKRRSENPAEFSTLDGELRWILHYLPELSPTRDDILLQLIDEKANTPNDMKKIRLCLLRAPENIRERKQSQVVFGTSVFEEYMKNQNAADKMEFLLWVMGISKNKPFFLKRFEHEYNVSLNGMRDNLINRKPGYYKNVGDSALEEFLEKVLLGENGILYDAVVSGIFLSTLSDTLMPSQKNNLAGAVYDAVFHRADVNRQCAIVIALLTNFLREKGTTGGISEGRAIRIFLESLGLIGVKIAQFLSTYEAIPEDIKDELRLLKDRAPQLNKDVAFDMIAKIYGSFEDSPINEVLECIGSASIKVVYRAHLKDGREIVIKIKRPEVEKKAEEDLAFLRDILSDPAVKGALSNNNIEMPKQLGNRITDMILEEMNLKGEVENQARLREGVSQTSSFRGRVVNRIFNYFIAKTFKTPRKKHQFKVPATIDVQNNSLIIEDFVNGKRIRENDDDAMIAVARELVRQIFLDGFYHADPHTGNIFVGIDGDIIYFIDVGSASQISLRNRYILYQLMKALQSGEGRKVLNIINKMTGKNLSDLTQSANGIAASKENVIKKIIMVFKVLEDSHVAIDKELISIFRCFGQGESLFRAALLSEENASSVIEQPSAAGSPAVNWHTSSPLFLNRAEKGIISSVALDSAEISSIKLNGGTVLPGGIVKIGDDKKYPVRNTSFEKIESMFSAVLVSSLFDRIAALARAKAINGEKLYVLDWGAGNLRAVKELSERLARAGINNVVIIAFGNIYYPDTGYVPENAVFILDDVENLTQSFRKYFPHERIDVVYSYMSLRHLLPSPVSYGYDAESAPQTFIDHLRDLSGLLTDDGFIVFDINPNQENYIRASYSDLKEIFSIVKPDFKRDADHGIILLAGKKSAGSPVADRQDAYITKPIVASQEANSGMGGIDMRSLPQHTVIQPMAGASPVRDSPLRGQSLNLNKEWQEIERMASSGITPSCERLREYLLSLQDPNSQIDKVLACIADILRQEEEKACCTEPSLREILVLLESGKPANELRLALAKIQVLAKEPQLIAQ